MPTIDQRARAAGGLLVSVGADKGQVALAARQPGRCAACCRQPRQALQQSAPGERWLLAELYRHKGQLLLRQRQPEMAEEFYRKALSVAEEQGAKLWELRTAMSLARLQRDRDCRAEARDRLAAVYGWFTEGFDTTDLKEAKALLNELA